MSHFIIHTMIVTCAEIVIYFMQLHCELRLSRILFPSSDKRYTYAKDGSANCDLLIIHVIAWKKGEIKHISYNNASQMLLFL